MASEKFMNWKSLALGKGFSERLTENIENSRSKLKFGFPHILSEEFLWRTIYENNNKTFKRFFVFENSGIM